jgi:2',3'-cyclic-nucleotide 2'-phosphodiesterase (5'-nucleotidase family)
VANLTLEAGNFAPAFKSSGDSVKARGYGDFYRKMNYDAVALSSREVSYGFGLWKDLSANGLPILAANVFSDPKGKKPMFRKSHDQNGQFLIKKDRGDRLGVIGLVSETAWRARRDTSGHVSFKSPYLMADFITKIAKHVDHLTVVGEFTMPEADSLAKLCPLISVIVSSGLHSDQASREGKVVIVGMGGRGNNGNYLDWNFSAADTISNFTNKTQVLDTSVPEDSATVRLVADLNSRVKATGATVSPK